MVSLASAPRSFISTLLPTRLLSRPLHGAIAVPNSADNSKAVITTAVWRSKPSWALVAAADRTINLDLERWYVTRANCHKVEVEVAGASHSVYVSRPKRLPP